MAVGHQQIVDLPFNLLIHSHQPHLCVEISMVDEIYDPLFEWKAKTYDSRSQCLNRQAKGVPEIGGATVHCEYGIK